MTRHGIERIWYGQGLPDRAARALLAPLGWTYAAMMELRNALYDRGVLATHPSPLPALALGNLSVGGTGKTPVAAWAASELARRGARPAIVLRGYGADEPLVHARLNPQVPVVVAPDRVRGVAEAVRLGADCAVLDDAFQHRRIARVADWVLVSAERWQGDARRLPAGPMRESSRSLGRASVVVVTRKTASLERAAEIADQLARRVPSGASAIVHLTLASLVGIDGVERPPGELAGRRCVAVAAVGEPESFFAQVRSLGIAPDEVPYPDHHHFDARDVEAIARRAEGTAGVVCTLKDFVKLAPRWRGASAPLWYVSQAAAVDRGRSHLAASLEAVLTARVPLL